MPSFGTNFHATLDELGDLVEGWLDQHPIVVSAFAFPPSRMVPITRDTLREVLARPEVHELVFTDFAVNTTWTSGHDVAVSGVDPLFLNIGRLEPRGLAQSWLAAKIVKPIWKKINADLKKKTTAGADLLCEDGSTRHNPNVRFTAGAKALAAAGVPLRQFHQSTNFMYLPK